MAHSFDKPTLVSPEPYLELNNQGQILRLYLKEDEHRLGRGLEWADLDVPVGWEVVSRKQAILKKEGKEYRLFDGDGTKASRNGIFTNGNRIGASGCLLKHGLQFDIGQSAHNRIQLTYFHPTDNPVAIPSNRRLVFRGLKQSPIQLGRAAKADDYSSMQLDAPTVSRLHATLLPDGQGGYFIQDSSSNGTFVDGERISKRVKLRDGSKIQIGPFSLLYTKEYLELLNNGSQVRLDVQQLRRIVTVKGGAQKAILDDVSLVIETGQLVALVGGSGAGKSTLMKSLLGIAPVTSGSVYLNGDNLRRNWAVYRSQIGYVPQ
ncbi:MAG: FHA domain-containing protein, partial [Cyanobacteria bacterium J06649_11]